MKYCLLIAMCLCMLSSCTTEDDSVFEKTEVLKKKSSCPDDCPGSEETGEGVG